MWRKIISTEDDKVLTLLRVALAIMVFPHGAQKLLGWFGGFGFSGTMGFLTQQMHIPAALALLVFAAEFFGALGVFFGFLGRIAAFGIAVDLTVVAVMAHLPNGFFLNYSGQQKGEGVEFLIVPVATAIAIVIRGSGAWSIDRALMRDRTTT
jgi:putative oxidoreductase